MKHYGIPTVVEPAVERKVVGVECGDLLPVVAIKGMLFYHNAMKSLFMYIDQWYKIPFGDGHSINAFLSQTAVQDIEDSCMLSPDLGGTYLIKGDKEGIVVTMPPVTITRGVKYTIKSASPHSVTITGVTKGEVIDGYPQITIDPFESVTLQCDKYSWYIINSYSPKPIVCDILD